MLQAAHYDAETIRECAEKVASHWQQLMLKMEDRLKLVNASVAFYKTSEQVRAVAQRESLLYVYKWDTSFRYETLTECCPQLKQQQDPFSLEDIYEAYTFNTWVKGYLGEGEKLINCFKGAKIYKLLPRMCILNEGHNRMQFCCVYAINYIRRRHENTNGWPQMHAQTCRRHLLLC